MLSPTNPVIVISSAQKMTSSRWRMTWIALVALVALLKQSHVVALVAPKPVISLAHHHRFGLDRIQFSNAVYSRTGPLWFSNNDSKQLQEFADGKNDGKQEDNTRQKEEENVDYQERLARLDETIAKAEAERKRILRSALDRIDDTVEKDATTCTVPIEKEENESALIPVEEWTPRVLQRPPLQEDIPLLTRSRVSRSDAGTLVIEITPQGISSGVLFNGAFSVAWFSAIVPATLTALSGGLFGVALFMVPFWAAGGMVAKQAVVDPFVSNTVTIGQYAWSVEQRYGSIKRGPVIQKQEGSTADLQGAKVECPMIVNNVPQYQLNLYSTGRTGRTGMTSLGVGLPEEELQKVAAEINSYLKSLSREEEEDVAFQ
jgi:hypothetical protein